MLIHLWVPGLEPAAGGIQAYSAQMQQALQLAGHDCRTFVHGGRRLAFIRQTLPAALLRRPDCLMLTHLNFTPLAAIAKRITGVPYAVSLHGIEAWNISSPALQRAVRLADALLPVSAFTRRRVEESLGQPLPPMKLLANTVDPDRFRIAAKSPQMLEHYGIAANAPIILTIGRLAASEAYKGQDAILRALPAVLTRQPHTVYLIVGEGDDRPRLERLAREMGVAANVRFAGHVPARDLPAYYQSCDVFAMPSRGEGFGIVYLEAMACGKPVIASPLDAGADALDQGRLGRLADPTQSEELAGALLDALEPEPKNFRHLEPSALREAMLETFGPAVFRQTLADILQSLKPCAA